MALPIHAEYHIIASYQDTFAHDVAGHYSRQMSGIWCNMIAKLSQLSEYNYHSL